MKIIPGYLYHIKDEFWEKVNDCNIPINHGLNHERPLYLAVEKDNYLWFVPLSSKVEKYKRIMLHKIQKYGECKTIIITKIVGRESAILLQNAFPIISKYIDSEYLINGNAIKINSYVRKEILNNFNYMLEMKQNNHKLFSTNVDRVKKIMFKELAIDKSKNISINIETNESYDAYFKNIHDKFRVGIIDENGIVFITI